MKITDVRTIMHLVDTQSKFFMWFSKIILQILKVADGCFQWWWNQQHGIYTGWAVLGAAGGTGDCAAWGRGAGRGRQAFSLVNKQVVRNASKFKQNTLWCSIIWALGSSLLSLIAELQNKQRYLPFLNSVLCSQTSVQDDTKVSFSPLGLVSWGSFRSAAILFSSTSAWMSVTQMGSAGRQGRATDLDRFVQLKVRTGRLLN